MATKTKNSSLSTELQCKLDLLTGYWETFELDGQWIMFQHWNRQRSPVALYPHNRQSIIGTSEEDLVLKVLANLHKV